MSELNIYEDANLGTVTPYDTSDINQINKRAKDVRAKLTRSEDGFKQMIATRNGRAWIFELLAELGVFRSPFALEALMMAYHTARRDVGVNLMGKMTTRDNLPLFVKMMEENNGPGNSNK